MINYFYRTPYSKQYYKLYCNIYLHRRIIHNQSYIYIKHENNDLKNKIKILQNTITQLSYTNIQLQNKNFDLHNTINNLQKDKKDLQSELYEKTKFYNLNIYKF